MQFYLDLTADQHLKIMCSYCFSQFQAAGSGGRSLPVHHPVLHYKDRGSDGQRRLPHCLVCHHCHGVPGQRGHHLREFLVLARPSGGQKPTVHAVVLGRPFQSANGLGGGPKDNIILCTYTQLKTKSNGQVTHWARFRKRCTLLTLCHFKTGYVMILNSTINNNVY